MSDVQYAEKVVGWAPLYSNHGFWQQVEIGHWGRGVILSGGRRGELITWRKSRVMNGKIRKRVQRGVPAMNSICLGMWLAVGRSMVVPWSRSMTVSVEVL